MILIAENRKLQMREVLSHPLGPFPWALSTADGSLRENKTKKNNNKEALAKEQQKCVPFVDVISRPLACMIDAMALVQRLKGDHRDFCRGGRISIELAG